MSHAHDHNHPHATPDSGVTLALLTGGRGRDFSERQNDRRVELRVRYFF